MKRRKISTSAYCCLSLADSALEVAAVGARLLLVKAAECIRSDCTLPALSEAEQEALAPAGLAQVLSRPLAE